MLAVASKTKESFEENDSELSDDEKEDVESKLDSSVSDNDVPEDENDDQNESEDEDDFPSEDDSVDESDEKQETNEVKDPENVISEASGGNVVENILARDVEARNAISVSKIVELQFDLGRLLACDSDSLDHEALSKSKDEYLRNLARDNTQLLINNIWQLPISREGTDILAKLPDPTYKLPREKPVPKPKALTKWEKFAQEKGISKKKRGSLRWDDELQKWVPWWGYKRVRAEKEKNWMAEVGAKDDPFEDPFAKKKAEKVERIAKNEYQRLRNIAVSNKVKIPRTVESQKKVESKTMPRVGFLTADKMNSEEMNKAVTIAKASTASAGKFQSSFPKEKMAKGVKLVLPMGVKRKAPMKLEDEKEYYLNMVNKMMKKKPKLDIDKAVNRQFHEEERARAEEKKNQKPKGRGRKGGRGGKGGKKSKGDRSARKGGKGGEKGGRGNARKRK